ncbi:hypothetical protein AUR64_14425 [Haloprofundus marisrubri]|uniref:Uncharacterized protein n=1 Tax=Haloprofundus marisrubri TaxID=1514971 RepID=A0A0W1R677_9EURY|nr:hypothetical protein AUR64_14425 [Haloprofundus marisrubri]
METAKVKLKSPIGSFERRFLTLTVRKVCERKKKWSERESKIFESGIFSIDVLIPPTIATTL